MALLTTSSWFRKNYKNFKGHMSRLRGNCDRFTESDSSDPESLLKTILWMSIFYYCALLKLFLNKQYIYKIHSLITS